MTTKPQAVSQARIVPPKFKFIQEIDFTYRPTKWERLKIAIGMNLDMRVFVESEHSLGKTKITPTHRVVNKF